MVSRFEGLHKCNMYCHRYELPCLRRTGNAQDGLDEVDMDLGTSFAT